MKKLRFVVCLPNDNSYQHEQAAAAAKTALRLGAEVQVLHADNDAVTQSRQVLESIQSHSSSRPDGILLEPLTTTLPPGNERLVSKAQSLPISRSRLSAAIGKKPVLTKP